MTLSTQDFEYLKVVGRLIVAAITQAELVEQLKEIHRIKEAIRREAAPTFLSRIT